MFSKTLVSAAMAALLAGVARAETGPGFPIATSQNLTVIYGNNTISPGGELVPRPETAQRPTISAPVWWADEKGPGSCILLMVDLDVPRNGSRVQLIHWLALNITRSSPLSANTSGAALQIPDSNPVPYRQPSPPVGDIPHSYTFVLMEQPRNFTMPEQYASLAMNRAPFNVSQFAKDANLTRPLAGTWITVQNTTGTPTTSAFPPARPTPTGGSSTESGGPSKGGAAGGLAVQGRALWAGVTTALLAGVFAVAL
ncbi:phosphatidylethanolamine-binding pebp [Pyrenophora seminiperda CCB06]|uniref:Phosphatidylethanolamine-binding pebp n=1 Tax=Pyrenophora seminiperda CCB06 TaxID=1302712 RepID=A0A3M7M7Z6_9PLEO|nr:phosphatidylethanolamine-binding pebp [Pyrenophora seminiperda CCB06]